MTMNRTQTLLLKARNLILTHGWKKEEYGDAKSGYCAMGALLAASKGNWSRWNKARAVMEQVTGVTTDRYDSISDWNDVRSRRKSHVVAKFNKAIKIAGKKK
jgi:hypothetical protein